MRSESALVDQFAAFLAWITIKWLSVTDLNHWPTSKSSKQQGKSDMENFIVIYVLYKLKGKNI